MESNNRRVLVGMSGGIDSSAACMMLLDAGYEVVGLTLRAWDLPSHFSSAGQEWPHFIEEARDLARRLGIAHHVADERAAFKQLVVDGFVSEYLKGRTPNPCVMCNKLFKFRVLSEWADKLGCAHIATGHYVRVDHEAGRPVLRCGVDAQKDQSYFLWQVGDEVLARSIFPLGELRKTEVRDYLARRGLEVKARSGESMEVCFIDKDYRDFLREQVPELDSRVGEGRFVDKRGKAIGVHRGFPYYTVGQRKGLGIALGRPAYVLRLNALKNTVVLGDADDLMAEAMLVSGGRMADAAAFADDRLSVRIRYRSQAVGCTVETVVNRFPDEVEADTLWLVRFREPASAITPGQSAVFYVGDKLVGGGFICSQKGLQAYLQENHGTADSL